MASPLHPYSTPSQQTVPRRFCAQASITVGLLRAVEFGRRTNSFEIALRCRFAYSLEHYYFSFLSKLPASRTLEGSSIILGKALIRKRL